MIGTHHNERMQQLLYRDLCSAGGRRSYEHLASSTVLGAIRYVDVFVSGGPRDAGDVGAHPHRHDSDFLPRKNTA